MRLLAVLPCANPWMLRAVVYKRTLEPTGDPFVISHSYAVAWLRFDDMPR